MRILRQPTSKCFIWSGFVAIFLASLARPRYARPNHTPDSHFVPTPLTIFQKCLALSGKFIKVPSTSPFQLLIIFNLFSLHAVKMASITPFKISISEDKIKRLQQKLALTDLPSEVLDPTSPWSRGVPLSEIKRLAFYWQHHFNWRTVEAKLNTIPQYTVNIEVESFGKYDIHFIHQKSQVTNAIPLLFLHGWPSSFLEVTKMLPLLADGGKDGAAFHVVAPSLIDFGFSSASKKV